MGGLPRTAHEWHELSDEDVRDLGADFGAHVSIVAQAEMSRRLILALQGHAMSTNRASRRLEVLTVVLVVLTAAILWLTYQL